MIDRADDPKNKQKTDRRTFQRNSNRLRTDGGDRTDGGTMEEAENLPQKTETTETTETVDDTVSTEGTSQTEGIVEKAERSVKDLLGANRPTSTFGRQTPTEESRNSHKESMNSSTDLDLEEASRAIDNVGADVNDWNKDRKQYELAMQKQRMEFESDLAESSKEISSEVAKVQSWAESPLDSEMAYEQDANRGSFSFRDYDDLGLAEFVDVLSNEAEEADQLYTHRQEQIAELGRELDNMSDQDIGIEDSEELSANKGLGTDSKEISQYERRAVESRRKEVSDEIEMHRDKKNEHESDFVAYSKEVESAYRDHATEVGEYVAEAAEGLQETTEMLESLADVDIPVLENELGQVAPEEVSGKMLDDGEQQVRDEYRDAVNALGVKAAQQYSQIENALSELEEVEEGMSDEYFSDVMRSGKLRGKVDQVSGNGDDYQEHLTSTVDEALGDEYSASDKIRNVFRGIEPELG